LVILFSLIIYCWCCQNKKPKDIVDIKKELPGENVDSEKESVQSHKEEDPEDVVGQVEMNY